MAYAAADSNKIHTDVLTKARETCYKARGAFYACLKKESNKNLTEIAYVGLLYPLECKQCRNEYVNRCRFSWVKHFDRQYCRNTRVQTLFDHMTAKSDKIHTDVLTEAREACYKARDAFYACLKKESDKNPTEIASVGLLYPLECKQCRNEYVKQCRSSWVKHFDRQYCQNKRVQTLLDDKGSTRGPSNIKPNT
ncbi:uncharacterized protein LOC114177367 [Vigna unguiculata]|uniref:uncharacterized protein LOC114177367 n=1 Tax=Vigna unguiculata TaxID=3917 RepID=UPI001016AE19|nr:uncharacterized protein LOC114177367 [Vigna unguiculata]